MLSVTGEGPRLILQGPGWGPSVEYLRATLVPLLTGFRALTYDVRNTGAAPRRGRPGSQATERLTGDLDAVARMAGWGRFALVGHSHGAMIAAAYAAANPERVTALVLLTPSPSGRDTSPGASAIAQKWLDHPVRGPAARAYLAGPGEIGSDLDLARWMRRTLPALFGDLARVEGFLREIRRAPLPSAVAYRGCPRRPERWVVDGLARIEVPTLVLAGGIDLAAPPEDTRTVAARIPGAERAVFEGSGHHPWVEEPERAAGSIRGFLRRYVSPSRGCGRSFPA